MKTQLLILFLVLFVPNGKVFLQEIPECMCVPLTYPKTGQPTNQDSACVIDTCGIWFPSTNCDSAYWNNIQSGYGEEAKKIVYSKGFWDIYFSVPAIPIPAADADTIIYVDWTAIDTTYPEIRNVFRDMEENYGDLYFRKLSPTADERAKQFRLYFNSYVNVVTIQQMVRQINGVEVCDFGRLPYRSPEDYVIDNDKNELFIKIYPNPAVDYIELMNLRDNPMEQKLSVEIYNALGECVITSELHPLTESHRMYIEHLSSGIYFATIKSYTEIITKQLVIMR